MDPGVAAQSTAEPSRVEPALIDLDNHDRHVSFSSSATSDTSDGDDFFLLDQLGDTMPLDPPHSPRMQAQSNINMSSSSPSETQPAEFRPSPCPPLPPTAVRNDVPDPNRIPSSVFARTKSTNPMEWSVASNESLFSIHIGNTSFSQDNVFLMGRSGDVNSLAGSSYMSGDMTNFTGSPYDNYPLSASYPPPLSPSPPPASALPPMPPASWSKQSTAAVEVRHEPEQAEAVEPTKTATVEAMADVAVTSTAAESEENELDNDKGQGVADVSDLTKSISRQSDGSNASFQSFAFPILAGEGGRSGSMNQVGPEHQQMVHVEQAKQPERLSPEQHTPKLAGSYHSNTAVPAAVPAAARKAAQGKGCFSCCFSCCR